MPRAVRLVYWLAAAVAACLLGTTLAVAPTYGHHYDVATIARFEVHEFDDAPASTARLYDVREGSVSPSVGARGASTTPVAPVVATEAESAIPGLSVSEQRAENSLEQRIAEYQAKLEAYQADPFANDNLGILERAPSAEIQQSIIDGRVRHLQNEIQAFQD